MAGAYGLGQARNCTGFAFSQSSRITSRPIPLPQTDLSPIVVPVVPWPSFQSMAWIAVTPTRRPSNSTTQIRSSGLRALRSSHDVPGALPLFESAFEIAQEAGEQFLAADAAHMAALAAPDRLGLLAWTKKGTRIAESSSDPQVYYWLGPIFNNLGSAYMDSREFEKALESFQRALEVRKRYPDNP